MEYVNSSKRRFLALGAVAVAGYLTGCNTSPTSPQPPQKQKVRVSGIVRGTFNQQLVADYEILVNGTPYQHSGSMYSVDIEPGQYTIEVHSQRFMLPRKRTVQISSTTTIDIDGIDDMSFNLDHYKQMCLGAIVDGLNKNLKSTRFRNGINPKIVLVLQDAPQGAEDDFREAAHGVSILTSNILRPTFETSQTMIDYRTQPEGTIVASYFTGPRSSHLGGNMWSNYIIKSADVRIRNPPEGSKTILHELGHAIGLDHTSERGSIMGPDSYYGPSHDDIQSATLKYMRSPGSTINDYDSD